VPDQEVRKAGPVLPRNEAHEVAFDLHRIVLAGEAEALGKPADMRVDHDSLGRASLGRDDVRGLPPDSRKPDEVLDASRHPAVELLDQHLHRSAEVPRLLPECSGRPQVGLELFGRNGEVVLRPLVLPEELLRHAVHSHVRRLRGKHHGDQKLEVVAEAERDDRVGMRGRQPLDDRTDAFPLRPDAPLRLLDVAAMH
jgi:hypothetical protein